MIPLKMPGPIPRYVDPTVKMWCVVCGQELDYYRKTKLPVYLCDSKCERVYKIKQKLDQI